MSEPDVVHRDGYRAGIGPRTLLRIPVLLAAVVALAVTLAGRLAWTAWPFELVTNFPVQLAVVGLVLTLCALALRAPVTTAVAALGLVINAVVISGALTGDPRPAAPGARIVVGHLNAQTRSIDVDELGQYLETIHPDLFVVLDPVQSDVPKLTHAAPGFQVTMVGSLGESEVDFVRTVVLSRDPLDGVGHPADPAFGKSAVEMTIHAGASPVSLVAFGTDSPTTPGRANRRDRALNAAARWSAAHPARRVVMGDFNATPWSPSFRRLLHDGELFDSLDGFGLQVSWPESNPLLRIPIDHALLGPALAATDRGTGPSFGSQHRSLHVTVAPARAGG